MAITSSELAALRSLLEKLAPDHISNISASLREPGSLVGTAKGSANYDFFLKLTELGLAVEMPLAEDIDPQVRETVAAFSLVEEAKPEIERLLDSVPF